MLTEYLYWQVLARASRDLELHQLTAECSKITEFSQLLLDNPDLVRLFGIPLDFLEEYMQTRSYVNLYDEYAEEGDIIFEPAVTKERGEKTDFSITYMGWLPQFINLKASIEPEIRDQGSCPALLINLLDTRTLTRHEAPRAITRRNQLLVFSVYFHLGHPSLIGSGPDHWVFSGGVTRPRRGVAADLEQILFDGRERLQQIRGLSCANNPGYQPGIIDTHIEEIIATSDECYPLIDFFQN